MIRKSLLAALVASFAVVVTAGPASATHGGKYCENSKSYVLLTSPYCTT
ncbi:MAG: hypothetical protein M3Q29_12075 [Chloroflexota bacterium]|nr:hypothetical protein [Chloroflexota bacterium]